MAKKQAKKRHIANSDTDSENSYPASQPTNSGLSTTTKNTYVPRFLIIHSKKGETISSLSPCVSIAGEPKIIKNLSSGDLLIQCAKESHEKSLLQMKTFCDLKCSLTPPPFMTEILLTGPLSLNSLIQSIIQSGLQL